MSSIPVLILSGFLGSGKTTLLLRLLQDAQHKGLKAAILMNELGKQDIDGHLLKARLPDSEVERLFDGCICCDKKSEVNECMLRLIEREPDVIFIELTGVANPEEIADSLTEPRLLQRTRLKHIVTVLDAENVLDYNSIFSADRQLVETLRRQMEVADHIIVNKVDLVTPGTLDKIKKAVQKSNPEAVITQTSYSEMRTALLFDGIAPIVYGGPSSPRVRFRVQPGSAAHRSGHVHEHEHEHEHDHKRSYSRLQTVSLPYSPERPLSTKQIERFIKSVNGLLRAKGYLTAEGAASTSLVQFAGKRIQWSPVVYTGDQYLVLIGIGLDEKNILKHWNLLI